MSEGRRSKHTSFECVDKDMEVLPESLADTGCGLFYHVEANCNNHQELNCAVCTK